MWFKKKKDDNDTSMYKNSNLKREIEKLQENNKTVNDEITKLKRIIKYSASEPTYYLDFNVLFSGFLSCKNIHYIYTLIRKNTLLNLKN